MKRPRPYIPLSVRVQVAERQFLASAPGDWLCYSEMSKGCGLRKRLDWLLIMLFRQQGVFEGKFIIVAGPHALDHDPALILRKFSPRTMKYTPDANDPEFLIYREASDHQQKTTGRKPGALRTVTTKGSDIGIKTKFARLGRKAKRPRPRGFSGGRKMKIPSRPFPKRKP